QALRERFEPFRKAAGGKARALTVLIQFDGRTTARQAEEVFGGLAAAVARGDFCEPRLHRLGLLVTLKRGRPRLPQGKAAIDLARRCQLTAVTLDGPALHAGREATEAGLLNTFAVEELDTLLGYAGEDGLRVLPRQGLDPATTARHVWTGLSVARNMGFELGKYGLVPLSLEEQKEVIARIQYWFRHWCAAPVCYVDYPVRTARQVYHGNDLARGVRKWLEMAANLKVRVVLIDTAKKSEGRRLVENDPRGEKGYVSLETSRV